MIITVNEARAYFTHPTQQVRVTPEELPDSCEYWADSGVCLVFHPTAAADVWMVHIGVKLSAWGRTTDPARRILEAFWRAKQPQRIVAWIDDHRRPALALARRVGFTTDGAFPGTVMLGWEL